MQSSEKEKNISKNKVLSNTLIEEVSNYLLINTIVVIIREKLYLYCTKISYTKKYKLKNWLKLKSKMDRDLFYLRRFITEFKNEDYDYPIMKKRMSSIDSSVAKVNKLYEDIDNVFKSNIDYNNLKSNHGLQITAIIIAMIGILLSVISIISGNIGEHGSNKCTCSYCENISKR